MMPKRSDAALQPALKNPRSAAITRPSMTGNTDREIVLGVGGFLGHDANAALFVDGQLVAANQEERFTRRKHDGIFPTNAIRECLNVAGLTPGDVTVCVFAEKPLQSILFDRAKRPGAIVSRMLGRMLPESAGGLYNHQARSLLPHARFRYAWHHISHVAGAFYTAPFRRAAFLCIDGKGEDYSASAGVIDDTDLRLLWEQPYENGLGLLYTLVTYHLGFESFGSEYKVMGLAPYGKPRFADGLSRLFATDDRGGLRLHEPVTFEHRVMAESIQLVAKASGVPARNSSDPLSPEHVDLAASLQKVFEDEVFKMARFLRAKTGEPNLLFCGGCAQNCVVAGRLRAERVFEQLFNSPVGGDMGSGLGAALLYLRTARPRRSINVDTKGFYLGSEPGNAPASAARWRLSYTGGIHEYIAERLAEGRTVGWVRGRMELGARALGARSILADPRQPGMQSRLNLAVKFRESFRPFAPAILAEDVGQWFDSTEESSYMNYTANLLPSRRHPIPAAFATLKEQLDYPRSEIQSVIHVDFSARLQTVDSSVHPDFHRLLLAFKAVTGVPILINTSFNVRGQPIVRTAAEAWECFVNTDLDLLVVNDEVYANPCERSREDKLAWLRQFSQTA
jgi:carbamoyltransferase